MGNLAPLVVAFRPHMELLLDVMEFAVHVCDLATKAAAIVILFSALKLIIKLRSFGPEVAVFTPDVAAGAVLAQLAFNMSHHPVHVFHIALQFAEATSPVLEDAMIAVI